MSEDHGLRDTYRGITPDPDPTILTTIQSGLLREEMYRAVNNLRELVLARIDILSTSVNEFHVRMPLDVQRVTEAMRDLFDQKLVGLNRELDSRFGGLESRFQERDIRVTDANLANAKAIEAAFASQQKAADLNLIYNDKAISKSELATKEKIEGLQALLTGAIDDLRNQINGLTSRLDRGEGAIRGLSESKQERRESVGLIVGIASVAAVVISMLVGAIGFVISHPTAAVAPAPTPAAVAVVPLPPSQGIK